MVFRRVRLSYGMRCAPGYKLKDDAESLGSRDNPCEVDQAALVEAEKQKVLQLQERRL